VDVKPGKPIWFGVLDGPPRRLVFGLPGNPVSSLVCFELFARTAIRRLMGLEPASPHAIAARLAEAHLARGDRATYYPARFETSESGPVVQTVRWQGSADLRATVEANAMILFPPGEREYRQGETVDVILWDAPSGD
jgi:molybdopterin molybdotransferase